MRMLLKGLEPHQVYIVQLRTVSGERKSAYSRSFELQTLKDEIAPAPVTSLSGVMNEGNLSLAWVPPTTNKDGSQLTDLKDYRVTIGPVPADAEWPIFVYHVASNRADFTKEMNAAAFGRYRVGLTITVQARDLVGNLSDAVTIVKVKPKPSAPTGLAWSSAGNAFTGSWTAPSTNVDGSAFTDPNGYDVTVVYATTNRKSYVVPATRFDYSKEQNIADFGGVPQTAKTPLTLEVRTRDSVGQLSDPVSITAGNAVPLKVTGVTGTVITDGIVVKWTPTTDTDLVAHEIFSASTLTGAGTFYGRVGASDREYIHQSVAYTTDHYLYVVAIDEFSSRSPDSDRTGPHRPKSPFTVDNTPPAATTITGTTPTRDRTLSSAILASWTAQTADLDMAGYQIRYSPNVTPRVWDFVDIFDKDQTSYLVTNLQSTTGYVFQIRTYDTMINTSAWSAESAVITSSVSDVVVTNVSNSITVQTGGTIKSADYVDGTSGYLLGASGLDIEGGTVNARVIRAGELRSNINIATGLPDAGQPLWSLNLDGNLTVRNAAVKGKIVVGNAVGGTADDLSIVSANYGTTAAASQWAIKGDGTIDLKAGGSGANSVQINNTGISGRSADNVERFVLNTSGQFLLQTTNGGVRFDDNGIYGYSGATNTFYINRNGSAYFNGQIQAGSGNIAGWTIVSNSLSAGNLNLRSDLGMIYGGDGLARVAMRAAEGFWAGADAWANGPFRVTTSGELYSTSGRIGGFWINGESGLYGGDNASRVQMQPGVGFWAGANSRDSSPWRVNQDGYMYASNAQIYGNIVAYGGELHNLTVVGTLSSGNIVGTNFYTSNTIPRIRMGPAFGGSEIQFETNNSNVTPRISSNVNGDWVQISASESLALSQIFVGKFGDTWFDNYAQNTGAGGRTLTLNSNAVIVNAARVLNFENTTRQMINLFSSTYGIGVQSNGVYIRTAHHFSIYKGGSHNDAELNGGGGLRYFYIRGDDNKTYVTGGTVLSSSQRIKKNVKAIPKGKGKQTVNKLRPVNYQRTDEGFNDGVYHYGLIAEEVNEVVPEAIGWDGGDYPAGIDYVALIPHLIASIKDLSEEVDTLRTELAKKS